MEADTPRPRERNTPSEADNTREAVAAPVTPASSEDGGGIDLIGSLPDDILVEIICLLPIKEGTCTRTLAYRWRDLWHVTPLNLDCCRFLGIPSEKRHRRLVANIVSNHRGPVRRFRCIGTWVMDDPAMHGLLTSSRFDELQELASEFMLAAPYPDRSFWFRYSHTIHLARVGISEQSIDNLIGGCPVLDSLNIKGCFGFTFLQIRSQTLRIMVVDNDTYDETWLEELVVESVPSLELLHHLQTTDLVLRIIHAPRLENIGCTSNTMPFFGPTAQELGLTMVSLAIKTLTIGVKSDDSSMVIGILKRFPCLENLKILLANSTTDQGKNSWSHEDRRPLDTHVKTVEVYFFNGKEVDIPVISFFLTNTTHLQSITLRGWDIDEKKCTEKYIFEYTAQHITAQHRKIHSHII
ncbi:hypothetical protein BRADI_1g27476v3 [Brachypodium distachyon]|uniref:F-box domain-containing protein n=1 Tax=Brachypodium distachyon TaxID=15368 RepID=A0A0Q3JE24_BRADI|nr:hypothetical protein BRADI_1g27476v3 [Brachypodium distachyon]